MPSPAPFADTTRPLAIRAGNLLDVEAGGSSGRGRSSCATPGSRRSPDRTTGTPDDAERHRPRAASPSCRG